jgi:hypothetical protein
MKGTYLFPQSFIVSAVLLARDIVHHPLEIGLTELLTSQLSRDQVGKIIRAMNALHTHNRVHAHHAERNPLRLAYEQGVYKLRRFGMYTHRPILESHIEDEWTHLKPEAVARIFSLARIIPDFPERRSLPLDMPGLLGGRGESEYRPFDRETMALQSPDASGVLRALVDSAYWVAIHEPKFHALTKGYKALIKKIGSTSPQADVLKDRISAHLITELQRLHPDLDWAAYIDYRHPAAGPN